MKIKFCGAAGTTTGSQHLLEVNGQRILLDCGLYQGRRHDTYERNKHFSFNPAEVDCVVLSHAHIDHSGNLPNLTKQGFDGNIYSTFATRDLCQIMLADSAKIQEQDSTWLNKKRKKQGLPPVEPIYTGPDAEQCLRNFINVGYDRAIPIARGVTMRFIDAGHILGSAQVILEIEDEESKQDYRLLFSGDIGRGDNKLLRDPVIADEIDYVIMESTYGGREHEQNTDANDLVARILGDAIKKKGKIIIPAFAVERTQQLLYTLHELLDAKAIPKIPIYVDSPLAVSATEIFRLHPECFNQDVYEFLFEKRDPFGFENLTLIRSVAKSKALNASREPAIIISASGMCEAGRVLHHLRNNIEKKSTTLLFVGYCAEQTLGWKIREGYPRVKIFGEEHAVRAEVEILDSFSGHADHSELVDYFAETGGKKKKTWLVHGEQKRSEALMESLRELDLGGTIDVAEWEQEVEI
ncbi:MAG: MBL fold metallo-hydrolase [Verrucomicrobiota bacterium]